MSDNMVMDIEKVEVSVIVATYNSSLDKIMLTLRSVIEQSKVGMEIMVADDGSVENHAAEIEGFLRDKGIENYRLLMHEHNEGTIKNCYDAVCKSKGKYIKLISPGDCLYGIKALRKWIDHIEKENREWSFCDTVYYHLSGKEKIIDKVRRHPMVLRPYREQDDYRCRRNVVVYADCILGASTLVHRDLFIKYLGELTGRTKYAEDFSYRLMMWDDIVPCYYPCPVMLYENGTGISSSRNAKWVRILQKEWDVTTEILMGREPDDDQIKIRLRKKLFLANRFRYVYILYRVIWRYFFVLFEPEKYTIDHLPQV